MNEFFINENDIYSPKTKRYFKEVSSSFHNGNYRSAIVMLYSTVIADLILKLQDLRDTSEDKKAETILSLKLKVSELQNLKMVLNMIQVGKELL